MNKLLKLDFTLHVKHTFSDMLYFKDQHNLRYGKIFAVDILTTALHIFNIYKECEELQIINTKIYKTDQTSKSTANQYIDLMVDFEKFDYIVRAIAYMDDDTETIVKRFEAILIENFGNRH